MSGVKRTRTDEIVYLSPSQNTTLTSSLSTNSSTMTSTVEDEYNWLEQIQF